MSQIPGPLVTSGWNLSTRDYEDRTFRWTKVTGEFDPGPSYEAITRYTLQVTPHVQLTNLEEMFTPYNSGTGLGNGRLLELTELDIGSELTDMGDGSVTYTMSLENMAKVIAPGFEKYLWRVIGVDLSARVDGTPSDLQNFRGRVMVPSVAWTVEKPEAYSSSLSATIRGTKSPSVTVVTINDNSKWTSYPSPDSWQAEVPLDGGRNVFFVRAIDAQGNGSEYRQVEIRTSNEDLDDGSYFNRFDDFGYQMSLPRLPGERNASYRDRIKDVLLHRASPRYAGLMNAFGRELDLSYMDQGLSIAPGVRESTGTEIVSRLWGTSSYIYVQSGGMQYRNMYIKPDGNTWRAQLPKYVVDRVVVEQPIGKPIDPRYYVVEEENGEFCLRFLGPEYTGKPVWVSYAYAERVQTHGATLSEVVSALNALTEDNTQIIEVTMNSPLTGTESAAGLQAFPPISANNKYYQTAGKTIVESLPVRWINAELCPFMEDDLRSRYVNSYGSLFNTEYSGWAFRVKAQLHTTWGFLIADKNLWSHPQLVTSGVGDLPSRWDMFTGSWTTTGAGPQFSTRSAWPRGWIHPSDLSAMIPYGIPRSLLYSGIGDGHDLYALIEDGSVGTEAATPTPVYFASGDGIA